MGKLVDTANKAKFFLASKTFQGLALIALPVIANAFGYDVLDEFKAAFPDLLNNLSANLDQIIQGAGVAWASYGRATSKADVWFVRKPKA